VSNFAHGEFHPSAKAFCQPPAGLRTIRAAKSLQFHQTGFMQSNVVPPLVGAPFSQ